MSSGWWRRPGWSCVRLLGGRGYWPYGIEQVAAACRASTACRWPACPATTAPTPSSPSSSTAAAEAYDRLWRYLVPWRHRQCRAGAALRRLAARPDAGLAPSRCRCRGPGSTIRPADADLEDRAGQAALLVFYRALVQSGDLAPIDALLDALGRGRACRDRPVRHQPEGRRPARR